MKSDFVGYVHLENVHNFKAAIEIVPLLKSLLNPKSVVDVGCGTGTWLKIFIDNGITDVLGIDGWYLDKSSLKVDIENFIEFDLNKPFVFNRKFDLAISLEVAEHLRPENSNAFVESLSNLSNIIVFSAAIPNQGGQNHLNEQPPIYWINKFEEIGYKTFDILRPLIWENSRIDAWYKQNILIFSKDIDLNNELKLLTNFNNSHIVHHELLKMKEITLKSKSQQLNEILNGHKRMRYYIKLLYYVVKFKVARKFGSFNQIVL